jgi:hypothetical protein
MKLEISNCGQFSHSLHFPFVTEMDALFSKHDANAMNIADQVNKFSSLRLLESECYKIIRKSNYSELKEEADNERDSLLIGIKNTIKTSFRHFKPEVKEAAKKIIIVFDAYDRPVPIVDQPYDTETISIENLLRDLNENYSNEVRSVGLTEWLTELEILNNKFAQLVKARHEEGAKKTNLRMVEVRRDVDEAWKEIILLIKGDIVRYGEEKYIDFIADWNELVKHYNDIWAQEQGRKKAKKEKEKEEKEKEGEGEGEGEEKEGEEENSN